MFKKLLFVAMIALPCFSSVEYANAASTQSDVQGIERRSRNVFDGDTVVAISLGEVTTTSVEATFTPSESCSSYFILLGVQAEMDMWVSMMGATIEQLVQSWGVEKNEASTYVWEDMTPDTEYTIYALAIAADSTYGELETLVVTTGQAGGDGVSVINITISNITETSVTTVAVPNDQTAEYHYGLIQKSYYDQIGADSALSVIRNDNYPLFATDTWTWLDLIPNETYYALGTGFNANGEWGTTTLVEFITSVTGIESPTETTFNMYPNPANNLLNVSGDNIKTISVYNAVGQKVFETNVGSSTYILSTDNFTNGVYFMRINNVKTMRFVVSH